MEQESVGPEEKPVDQAMHLGLGNFWTLKQFSQFSLSSSPYRHEYKVQTFRLRLNRTKRQRVDFLLCGVFFLFMRLPHLSVAAAFKTKRTIYS